MECSKRLSERDVLSYRGLPQEPGKSQINNITIPKGTREAEQRNQSGRKEILKIRSAINKTEEKKVAKDNETKG